MEPLKPNSYKHRQGKFYDTPTDIWDFLTPPNPDFVADPNEGKATDIARDFYISNPSLFKLGENLPTPPCTKVLRSLGAWHVLFGQNYASLRIHRAYVTVHLDNQGRVYLVKNRAMPVAMLPPVPTDFRKDKSEARESALKAIPAKKEKPQITESNIRVLAAERMWFPKEKTLRPSYRFRIHQKKPRHEWIIHIDGETGKPLDDPCDILARLTGRASVFDPNPVAALGGHKLLLTAKNRVKSPPAQAYRIVTLEGLRKTGFLAGPKVTTHLTKKRVKRSTLGFFFKSNQRGFEEVMAYYHLDSAVRYLEDLGFKGDRRIFRRPLSVDARGTRRDNSWYSSGLRRLTFGYGGINDAEDGEVILHEFGHALLDAICPRFGLSRQAGVMSEGFSDYLAASYFFEKKSANYQTTVMTWNGLNYPKNDPRRPRAVIGRKTFASYSDKMDPHESGKIWSATLWDIRRALGPEIADKVIIESLFQLDAYTTFPRGARAILDADRNLYPDSHEPLLKNIFDARHVWSLE